MKHRDATKHLINHYHLQEFVKYGKTRLFVRTTMTMYFLENLRTNMIPEKVKLGAVRTSVYRPLSAIKDRFIIYCAAPLARTMNMINSRFMTSQ